MSNRSNKMFIILGIVLVLAGAYYALTAFRSDDMMAGEAVTDKTELVRASERIISDTNKVNAIDIDAGLFADTQFRSLVDRRVQLPDIATGRANPFAPLP